MAGYPTVHTIHGVMHNEGRYFGNALADRLNARLCAYLAKKAISGASHSIAVSSYVRNEYQDVARSGITVIPNAVEDRFFCVESREVPDRMLYVGFVSRLKNILGLVRAFEAVKRSRPRAELAVAGSVQDQAYYADILNYIEAQGLGGSIHLLGPVNQDDLLGEYAKAAVVCTFSWVETFSLTVAQGMAAGKPAISSDSGGPSDLITGGETGFLVAPGDEKAFAEKSILLLEDGGLRSRMGAAGREVAEQRFRKEVVAAQTVEVYEQVLRTHSPAGQKRVGRRLAAEERRA
jgi:glycosyltransferase involved in cell wall biosynthesis